MSRKDQDHLDALLLEHRESTLSPEQREELQQLLRSSPEARRDFARIQLLDAALHLMHADESMPAALPAAPRGFSMRQILWIAVAASAVFAFGVLWERFRLQTPRAPSPIAVAVADPVPLAEEPLDHNIAVLRQALNATWEALPGPQPGAGVPPGRLRLLTGIIQLDFYRGAQLIVEAPADVELVSAEKVICHRGVLRAQVPPQARGFTIISPAMELVDMGTEFAVSVDARGESEVHVFDGLVEAYPPGVQRDPSKRQDLTAGSAISITSQGQVANIAPQPADYPTFSHVASLADAAAQARLQAWRTRSAAIATDSRMIAHYDFKDSGRRLLAHKPEQRTLNGAIIGCAKVDGRWPGKGALEFKRPGDRVRIQIPGNYDAMTLTTWIRLDSIKNTYQALLLTDGFEVGSFHWQISSSGDLRFGVRIPNGSENHVKVSDYSVPNAFDPGRIGMWSFLCTVYDRQSQTVRHYLDGQQIAEHPLKYDQPLHIGSAEIGNWGAPLTREAHPIRNFNGRIDELTIWSAALNTEEIENAYRQGRP